MSFNPNKLSDQFSSAPQIEPSDIAQIAAQGYKTILNCRPDGEAADQPTSAQIRAAAEQHGLQYFHYPVAMGTSGAEHLAEASRTLSAAPTPMLGFCRSGMRATSLYQAAMSGTQKKTLTQWLKSKCLITRLWRWCKNKRCAGQCAVKQ